MASAFPIGIFANKVGWTYEFKADGTHNERVVDPYAGIQYSSGTYTVTENQVVLKESASMGGDCGAVVGTYTWVYDGKALSFKMLDDRCGGREGVLTSGPWVKKP